MSKLYFIEDTTLENMATAIRKKTGGTENMTPEEMVTAINNISVEINGEAPYFSVAIGDEDYSFEETEIVGTYKTNFTTCDSATGQEAKSADCILTINSQGTYDLCIDFSLSGLTIDGTAKTTYLFFKEIDDDTTNHCGFSTVADNINEDEIRTVVYHNIEPGEHSIKIRVAGGWVTDTEVAYAQITPRFVQLNNLPLIDSITPPSVSVTTDGEIKIRKASLDAGIIHAGTAVSIEATPEELFGDLSPVIKSGEAVLGFTGTFTSDADAVAGDMLAEKTAYVNGEKITGTIPSQGAQTIIPGTSHQTITSGRYLSGDQTIEGDTDLVAENIKKNVDIFGVKGTFTSFPIAGYRDDETGESFYPVTAGSMLKNTVGYINGNEVTGSIETKNYTDITVDTTYDEDYPNHVKVIVPEGYYSHDATKMITKQEGTTVTPGTTTQTAVTANCYTTGAVKVEGDTNLVAGNIKKDVSIFGVTGTYEGSGGDTLPEGVITNSGITSSGKLISGTVYINPPSGSSATELAVDKQQVYMSAYADELDTDLKAENIKKDVEIFGVTGTYEGDGGSVDTVELATPEINVDIDAGKVKATVTQENGGVIEAGSSTEADYTLTKLSTSGLEFKYINCSAPGVITINTNTGDEYGWVTREQYISGTIDLSNRINADDIVAGRYVLNVKGTHECSGGDSSGLSVTEHITLGPNESKTLTIPITGMGGIYNCYVESPNGYISVSADELGGNTFTVTNNLGNVTTGFIVQYYTNYVDCAFAYYTVTVSN